MVARDVFRADGSQENISVLRRADVQDALQHIRDEAAKQIYTIEHAELDDRIRVSTYRNEKTPEARSSGGDG